MEINRVTITGADDKTEIDSLVRLSAQYEFVEWGILFSRSKSGSPRYPAGQWTERIMNRAGDLAISAHLCGAYAKAIMEKQDFELFERLSAFKRFQINFNFSFSAMHNLEAVIAWAQAHPETSIIFQYNRSNKPALYRLMVQSSPENIHLLYDSSGGRGKALTDIQNPFPRYTGYSGGFGPENIISVCKAIEDNLGGEDVWIDMESRVRTDDNLDMEKVEKVLERTSLYISKNAQG